MPIIKHRRYKREKKGSELEFLWDMTQFEFSNTIHLYQLSEWRNRGKKENVKGDQLF